MAAALALARRHRGETWPNPSVGCVIVSAAGRVVGRGATAPGGRPHAEPQALAMAGAAARGGCAYVTLEPCCHTGQTPPCTKALIEAGIARVVIGAEDPDPRVSGGGAAALRASGIAVETGVLAGEAAAAIAGFASRIRRARPLVTLKLASTLDGRIATRAGESRWITGAEARRAAHALRGEHDAVMVGVGTVLADDPDLTCRIPGYRRRPVVRILADSHLRTPLTARLLVTAREAPSWFLCRADTDRARSLAFSEAGAEIIAVKPAEMGIDPAAALAALAARGINQILVEGGGQLAAALLRADLVDRLAWFHAPAVMGGDGWPAAAAFGADRLAGMAHFRRIATRALGADLLSLFARAATTEEA
ncbi:MAG: bifunctional diaminohydroxyphosphoribosylaminopyrimidine deaminase/5-amino-6-(5-phosphoribosylamino)uracil reductase RibD [Rhodospirillales bacterium]|nr:bifunctional diaminohydroxyphosphoribosylaminopyrimidine deaminase/5-amino-6-(5-phosphoribosylamino)uracil reductase RibD [Rhodospirillales bacterium]